jgi:DNA polymerase-3 subunit delta'
MPAVPQRRVRRAQNRAPAACADVTLIAVTLAALEPHPHAAAVLGAAADGRPSHAYLLHGPAGSGKRAAARAVAAELLARGAADADSARTRALHGVHPDLTWVSPSGAHEMLRRDVDEAVVAAAAHTPFEATYRVFVLERADTMNDEAANALLKTLEEPADYVVLLLLTDRPTQVLPTIASRCQPVRFDAPPPDELARGLESRGAAPDHARAAARLGLGDGERALALAVGDGAALRAHAGALARAPLHGRVGADRPWLALLELARGRGAAARAAHEERLAEELQFLPRKEHRKRETEVGEQARRAERRAETAAIDHGLQLAGLWYRDLACAAAGAPELAHNSDRAAELAADAEGRELGALRAAAELVDDARARLALNVSYDLACEALCFRLERLFQS